MIPTLQSPSTVFSRRCGPLLSLIRLLSVGLAFLGVAAEAPAQEVADQGHDPWADVEEMVVVSGSTSSLLAEATTSAIAFDAADLQVERIGNVADLSNFTPNLEIKSPFAASNAVFFVRGVGLDDFNANSAGAVAIYQDGVFMNSPAGQLFQFFDNDGVDVLR